MIKKVGTIALLGLVLLLVSIFGSWYSQGHQVEPNKDTSSIEGLYDSTRFDNARSVLMPNKLDFAGEKVPLDNIDVYERMDRELLINTYWHTNSILMLKRAHRWLPIIAQELEKEGVPDDFKYIVAIETNFSNDTSPRGAVGFWQFLKGAGLENGLEITDEVDERYDPVKATRAAANYLNHSYKKFGSWTMAAASYNRGVTGMLKAIEHQKESDYYKLLLNEETARYLFRILAAKLILENPEQYGFLFDTKDLYQPYETDTVEVTQTIPSLVDWAQEHSLSYRQLKKYNPWLREDRLTVMSGKTYKIYLPK